MKYETLSNIINYRPSNRAVWLDDSRLLCEETRKQTDETVDMVRINKTKSVK